MRFHHLVTAAACTILSFSPPLISADPSPRILDVPTPGIPRLSYYQQLQQQATNLASVNAVDLPDTATGVSSSPAGVITLNITTSIPTVAIDGTQASTYAAATVLDSTGTQTVQQEALLGCAQTQFYAFMNVGSQSLKVAVDTTQSSLIVASTECSQCHVTTKYNVTSTPNTQVNRQNYVGQTVEPGKYWSGFTVTDTVSMPGIKFPFTYAVMTNQTNMFQSARCDGLNVTTSTPAVTPDGILGLGSPSNTLPLTSSFLLSANTTIASTNFAIQLCMNTGRLWLGGSDTRFYSEAPAYTPIQKSRFTSTTQSSYLLTFDGVHVGDTSVDLSIDLWGDIILDSGNSGIELPPAVFVQITGLLGQNAKFISAFGGTSFFTSGKCRQTPFNMDADDLNQYLPRLRFTLPPEVPTSKNPHPNATELILAPISSYIREFITPTGKLYCPSVSLGSSSMITRLGWGFMNQFTTIVEPQSQRVGFARTFDCGAFDITGGMGVIPNAVTPPSLPTSPFPILLILEIVISTLVGLSLIALSVYCYRRHTWSTTTTHMNRSNSMAIFDSNPVLAGALDIKKPTLDMKKAVHDIQPQSGVTPTSLIKDEISHHSQNKEESPPHSPIMTPQFHMNSRISTTPSLSHHEPINPAWTVHRDSTSGSPYWYNHETGISSWVRPQGGPRPAADTRISMGKSPISMNQPVSIGDVDIQWSKGVGSHGREGRRDSDGELEENPLHGMMSRVGMTPEMVSQRLQLPTISITRSHHALSIDSMGSRQHSDSNQRDRHSISHTNIHMIPSSPLTRPQPSIPEHEVISQPIPDQPGGMTWNDNPLSRSISNASEPRAIRFMSDHSQTSPHQ